MERLGFCTVEQIEYAAKLNLALSFFVAHLYFYGTSYTKNIFGPERTNRWTPLSAATKAGLRWSIHQEHATYPGPPASFCECQDGGHSYSEIWQRKGVRTRVLRYNSRGNEGGYHWRGLAASERWLFGQLKRRQEGWSYRRLRQSIQGNNSEKNTIIMLFFNHVTRVRQTQSATEISLTTLPITLTRTLCYPA